MVWLKDLLGRVVRVEEIEDEADGLIPSHGEEAVRHTDGHHLLLLLVSFW